MSNDKFHLESEAYASLSTLLAQGKTTAELFRQAELPVPAPLARMLDLPEANETTDAKRHSLQLPPLDSPWTPDHTERDWIWLWVADLQVTSLVLGILLDAGRAVPTNDIINKIRECRPDLGTGSAYNVGARLDGTVIERSGDGWRLLDSSQAPLLNFEHGCAWGPMNVFAVQEVAAHRRMVILHILHAMPDGLMVVQLVKQLLASDICKAKATKDLIKADISQLESQGKIRRVGKTRKWTTVDENKGGVSDG